MINPYAQAVIIDTITRMMDNGPDDPQPKIEHEIRRQCTRPSEKEFNRATYEICLEWFEMRHLFDYNDLLEWFKLIIR